MEIKVIYCLSGDMHLFTKKIHIIVVTNYRATLVFIFGEKPSTFNSDSAGEMFSLFEIEFYAFSYSKHM